MALTRAGAIPAAMPSPANELRPAFARLDPKAVWQFIWKQDFGFIAAVAYVFVEYVRPQQMWPQIDVLPWGQITVGLATLGALLAHPGRTSSPGHWLLGAFAAVIVLSSVVAYYPADSWDYRTVFLNWVLVYVIFVRLLTTPDRLLAFLLTFLLWNFYMSQGGTRQWMGRGFSFASWGVVGAPGWFANSGEFGVDMCLFFPLTFYFFLAFKPYLVRWKRIAVAAMPVTAVMGAVGSSSRGALVGIAAASLWMLGKSRYKVRSVVAVVLFGAAVWAITPAEQKERFSEAGDDQTSTNRLTYWKNGLEITRDNPLLGVGYNNWLRYYTAHYSVDDDGIRQYSQEPHNIFIQCMAELGLTGLAAFLALIGGTLWLNYDTRRRTGPPLTATDRFLYYLAQGLDAGMIGYLASGFFVTVLYYPFFWFNFAFTVALNNVARRHRQRGAAVPMAAPVPRGAIRPPATRRPVVAMTRGRGPLPAAQPARFPAPSPAPGE